MQLHVRVSVWASFILSLAFGYFSRKTHLPMRIPTEMHWYPWTFLLKSDFIDFLFMFVCQRKYVWIRTEITPMKTAHRYTTIYLYAKDIFICGVWGSGNDSLWFLQGKNPQLVYVNLGMLPKSILRSFIASTFAKIPIVLLN